eukprot:CAMPEP_0172814100 /NCGR_PEP_ID=MMETSP1075-20121228/11061_1 /TAXON_ID=2916 /ORGANISM="Ceratium fusus, Strain PA161109" /LENGTH=68 /DNA_ID=CAMNT_0013653883 /DNA_START=84 /DNA_END=290 /DNA_ORIENTATION=-
MKIQPHRPDLRWVRSVWQFLWERKRPANEVSLAQLPAGARPVAISAGWLQGDNPRLPGAFLSFCLQPG